jgi:N-acetyl-alpha-D-muramate 1-phosphate uridylyltransferase
MKPDTGLQAMILAAGLGTRLKPWTDNHPKALAPVNGKSLLQRNIEYLQSYGIYRVLVNVHHFAGQILDAIEKNKGWGSQVHVSDETDMVLETGGGLKKAAAWFNADQPFWLMNVDILTKLDLDAMKAAHDQYKPLVTLAVSERKSSRHFLFNSYMELCGWGNSATGEQKIKRAENNLKPFAFSGVHLIEPELLSLIEREGKFSMVDVYLDLCAQYTIRGYDHTGVLLMDVGKPESVIEAEKYFM